MFSCATVFDEPSANVITNWRLDKDLPLYASLLILFNVYTAYKVLSLAE